MVLLFGTQTIYGQKKTTLLLDADTGNEVDDLFAIVRVLIEPTWEVTALNATHWQTSHWAIPQLYQKIPGLAALDIV